MFLGVDTTGGDLLDDALAELEGVEPELDPNVCLLEAKLSLDVLALTKQMQLANGLRHENYSHYSAYCSRRLRRIRTSTKLVCGKPRQYVARPVRAVDVTDARCLTVPLLCAERAWSFAMQLKQDNAEDRGNVSRQRFHAIKRLKKAAKWARDFKELVDLCADDQTKLEAEAYASWMSGNARLEAEDFAAALDDFVAAETIYTHLAEATVRHRSLFQTKVKDEVVPAIQYCKYNVGRMEGSADAGEEAARRAAQRMQSRGGLLLSLSNPAALDRSLARPAEGGAAAAAARPATVAWRAHAIPLSDSSEVQWRSRATPVADAVIALVGEAEEKMAAIRAAPDAEAKLAQCVARPSLDRAAAIASRACRFCARAFAIRRPYAPPSRRSLPSLAPPPRPPPHPRACALTDTSPCSECTTKRLRSSSASRARRARTDRSRGSSSRSV
jgi:hypothetical protein